MVRERNEKLRVPPPPPRLRPGPGWREPDGRLGGPSGRGPRPRRRRPAGRTSNLVASSVVILGMLAVCLCVVLVSTWLLPLPGDGGRVNVLLLGIDRRKGDGWTYRTDTIMILTLDPETRQAGLLSIPRDLQLAIPGHGQDRINTANVFGYLHDYPGGGPALLEATIDVNFDIPIDGYVMIDFVAFEEIVDTLGGVEIEVTETLHDTRYPDPRPGDPHAYKTVHFDPGWQHMDGRRALAYARSRMSTSDFDRARRQQEIVLALRDKVLSLKAIPRWPALAKILREAVQTDIGTGEILGLARLASRIDLADLERVVIEAPLVYGHRRADGAAVQLPDWGRIDPVIYGLFGPPETR
ncbi:MAG: LCP family protein [Anaerolineae bacterium]